MRRWLTPAYPREEGLLRRIGLLAAFWLLLFTALALCGCGPRTHPIELELWIADFNQDTRDLLDKQLLPRFEAAHPGVKVNTQYISWTHLDEKLTISFAGGVAPDVFQVGAEYVGGLAYRGMAEPLDSYVKQWSQADDFFPASWSTCVYQGKVYGLPYLSAPRVLLIMSRNMRPSSYPRSASRPRRAANSASSPSTPIGSPCRPSLSIRSWPGS